MYLLYRGVFLIVTDKGFSFHHGHTWMGYEEMVLAVEALRKHL